jgi:hypothetical protein
MTTPDNPQPEQGKAFSLEERLKLIIKVCGEVVEQGKALKLELEPHEVELAIAKLDLRTVEPKKGGMLMLCRDWRVMSARITELEGEKAQMADLIDRMKQYIADERYWWIRKNNPELSPADSVLMVDEQVNRRFALSPAPGAGGGEGGGTCAK